MNRREILRTGEGASDAEARRALRHVVVGEHADGPGHAGAEELVARRGEDSEEEPAFGKRSAKNVTTGAWGKIRWTTRKNNGRAALAPGRAGRGDRERRTRRAFRDTHLKILHLLGPNAWTWLDASSMEMKRLRASFHLSLSLAVASGPEAPGAPFWVLPCLPNR